MVLAILARVPDIDGIGVSLDVVPVVAAGGRAAAPSQRIRQSPRGRAMLDHGVLAA